MLPVLIGSKALEHYSIVGKSSKIRDDIDIICDLETAALILAKRSRGDPVIDVVIPKEKSDHIIFEWCNGNSDLCKNEEYFFGKVLVPPLNILCAIYKSHVHRILPITSSQQENVDIWYNQVLKYNSIRSAINYKEFDRLVYNPGDSDPQHLREIYMCRFNETNRRVGDTDYKMDMKAGDFFDDKVERYIDHDKMHEMIAELNRSTTETIFKKFQSDESVGINYNLFSAAETQEKIQMFREEVMVLLLERALIPTLVECYKKIKVIFQNFEKEFLKSKLVEIGAHLITNLSGNGHHFLRIYALDHACQILDTETYDYDSLVDLATKISGVVRDYSPPIQRILPQHFVQEILSIKCNMFEDVINIDDLGIMYVDTDEIMDINVKTKVLGLIIRECGKKIGMYTSTKGTIYYYPERNIGFTKSFIFTFSKVDSNDGKVSFEVECMGFNDTTKDLMNVDMIKITKQIYYKSVDCEQSDLKHESRQVYINTYGTVHKSIREFIELIAKRILDVSHRTKTIIDKQIEIESTVAASEYRTFGRAY